MPDFRKTIPLSPDAAATMALQALGYILADTELRQRLLDLSGISPEDLRHGLASPPVLAAILNFLAHHEPDLIACAAALGRSPDELMRAARLLQGDDDQ